jgi:plasmid stabilization system protein ParE
MIGYDFHPEARLDVDEIWEFIREDNLAPADRLTGEIFDAVRALVPFSHQGHRRQDLTSRLLRFVVPLRDKFWPELTTKRRNSAYRSWARDYRFLCGRFSPSH